MTGGIAEIKLGIAYLYGEGVVRDLEMAEICFEAGRDCALIDSVREEAMAWLEVLKVG